MVTCTPLKVCHLKQAGLAGLFWTWYQGKQTCHCPSPPMLAFTHTFKVFFSRNYFHSNFLPKWNLKLRKKWRTNHLWRIKIRLIKGFKMKITGTNAQYSITWRFCFPSFKKSCQISLSWLSRRRSPGAVMVEISKLLLCQDQIKEKITVD